LAAVLVVEVLLLADLVAVPVAVAVREAVGSK
jgi:hypothetical protein